MPPEDASEPTRRPSSTRRRLLKGAAALATAGASAGCIATLPPLTQKVRFGRVDVPPSKDPRFRRWIPAPSARPPSPRERDGGEDDGYPEFMYHTPGNMGEDALGAPFTLPGSIAKAFLDYLGIGYENYDHVTSVGDVNVLVVEADFDRATVADTLTGSVYERAGSYRGYDLFARPDEDRLAAVGDGAVVYGSGYHDRAPDPAVEAVVDAGAGRVERYHEADDGFATLTERAGANPMTWMVGTGFDPTGKALGGTNSFTFDRSAAYFVIHLLYPEGTDAPKGKIRRGIEEKRRAIHSRAVDLQVDGRVATIEMRMDRSRYRNESNVAQDGVPTPLVTWDYEHDREAGTFRLSHVAGEPFDPGPIRAEFMGPGEDATKKLPEAPERFAGEDGTVAPGDELTLQVPSQKVESFRLVYEERGEKAWTTIFHHEFDEE